MDKYKASLDCMILLSPDPEHESQSQSKNRHPAVMDGHWVGREVKSIFTTSSTYMHIPGNSEAFRAFHKINTRWMMAAHVMRNEFLESERRWDHLTDYIRCFCQQPEYKHSCVTFQPLRSQQCLGILVMWVDPPPPPPQAFKWPMFKPPFVCQTSPLNWPSNHMTSLGLWSSSCFIAYWRILCPLPNYKHSWHYLQIHGLIFTPPPPASHSTLLNPSMTYMKLFEVSALVTKKSRPF